jgi:hypothetical protein
MKDALLLADAAHEQHVGRCHAEAGQSVAALGAAEAVGVHAVVDHHDPLRGHGEVGEDVRPHLFGYGDHPLRLLHRLPLEPGGHAVASAQLVLLPRPEGLQTVERHHQGDVEQRSHQHPAEGRVPRVAVHHVGLHGLGGHGQVHGERFEHRAVTERSGRPDDLLRGRVAAHAQRGARRLLVAEAADLDPGPASQGLRQLVDHDARPAIDVGRVLSTQYQHVHGAPVLLVEAV